MSRLMLAIEVAHGLDCLSKILLKKTCEDSLKFFPLEVGRPEQEFDTVHQCQNVNFEVE